MTLLRFGAKLFKYSALSLFIMFGWTEIFENVNKHFSLLCKNICKICHDTFLFCFIHICQYCRKKPNETAVGRLTCQSDGGRVLDRLGKWSMCVCLHQSRIIHTSLCERVHFLLTNCSRKRRKCCILHQPYITTDLDWDSVSHEWKDAENVLLKRRVGRVRIVSFPALNFLPASCQSRFQKERENKAEVCRGWNVSGALVTTWPPSLWLPSKFRSSSGKTGGEMEQLVLMKQLQDTNYYVNVCLLSSGTANSLLHLEV